MISQVPERWVIWAQRGLLAAALTATVLLAIVGAARMNDSARLRDVLSSMQPSGAEEPGSAGPGSSTGGPAQKLAQNVAQRNLFSPPAPAVQLTAIIGDKAFFSNGQSGRAGDQVGGLKVLELGPNWARVEIEGRERQMHVFQPSSIGGGTRPASPAPAAAGLPPGAKLPAKALLQVPTPAPPGR